MHKCIQILILVQKHKRIEINSYETKQKTIKNYAYRGKTENAEGIMKVSINEDGTVNAEINVEYYYAKGTIVKVNYIDKETKKILETKDIIGYQGDKYDAGEKEIKGYKLEGIPENAKGEMTEEPIEVNYYYIKVKQEEPKQEEKKPDTFWYLIFVMKIKTNVMTPSGNVVP